MSKFEQYLEAVRNVVINEGEGNAYTDLVRAIRDSFDDIDSEYFDIDTFTNDSLSDTFNFETDEEKEVAIHTSGIKFSIDKISKIIDKLGDDWRDIKASDLKPTEIGSKVELLIDKLEQLDSNKILTGDLLKEVKKLINPNTFSKIKQKTVGNFLSILQSDEYYDYEDY